MQECERRLFQTVTIPPAFPNEDLRAKIESQGLMLGHEGNRCHVMRSQNFI